MSLLAPPTGMVLIQAWSSGGRYWNHKSGTRHRAPEGADSAAVYVRQV